MKLSEKSCLPLKLKKKNRSFFSSLVNFFYVQFFFIQNINLICSAGLPFFLPALRNVFECLLRERVAQHCQHVSDNLKDFYWGNNVTWHFIVLLWIKIHHSFVIPQNLFIPMKEATQEVITALSHVTFQFIFTLLIHILVYLLWKQNFHISTHIILTTFP